MELQDKLSFGQIATELILGPGSQPS
ncbi:hypothetical protein AGR1C_Cc40189 [Agrobacterium fabacearum TT111]|nr:hypothetical protein AGR1C_Cc40189 [Agrobacterium fabacearum TT111]